MVLSATHRHSSGSVCQLIRFGWGNWNYPAFYQGKMALYLDYYSH